MSGAKERKVMPPGHPGLGAAKWQEERSLFARREVLDASRESVRIRMSVLFSSCQILSFSCLLESLRPFMFMHVIETFFIVIVRWF